MLPEDVRKAIVELQNRLEEMPSADELGSKVAPLIREFFGDCSVKDVSDFEYDRSFRYLIRFPQLPILLDQSLEEQLLLDHSEFNDLFLNISAVSPFICVSFEVNSSIEDCSVSRIPVNRVQMELFEKVQRFAYRIGYTILPAEVLDTSLDVTNMPCEDLNGNTVIDLLF